jgi:hypothetical protein
MGTLSTTESIAPLNPEINTEKYEHPCQVEDLNPGEQVPSQGTQLADLRSVRAVTAIYWAGTVRTAIYYGLVHPNTKQLNPFTL